MNKKLMLLALAAVSAAMFALPAAASAGTWSVSSIEKFTTHSGATTLTLRPNSEGESVSEVTCTTSTGSGKYTTSTTGEELTLTFTGCTVPSPFGTLNCNTSGQASGTIKTTDLKFDNIMIESTAQKPTVVGPPHQPAGLPGILITANNNHFASFTCGGFIAIDVEGNGIVGEIERGCGTSATTAGLNFASSSTGVQKYTQITTTGTVYDLSAKDTFTGVTRTASMDGTGTVTFPKSQTITCP
ncbi:MAG TPA: hypothetical protein VNC16_03605 [Solirubrobacterales bacterium]|jgi:hypothetical protein|nr:hypothetical protein [Solirubrobacterales bacterium]